MKFSGILITGGAGFVGSNLAIRIKQERPQLDVTVLDSLKRRGSELNVPRLLQTGVHFVHGDVRCPEDFDGVPNVDLLIDCAAEPSVQAGLNGSPHQVLQTNLFGTINCLEAARRHEAALLLLSTSRVYPIAALNALPYLETSSRYCWNNQEGISGFSQHGVAEAFPLNGACSFYGASKLSCEQLILEYVHSYGMQALINRCGVIAGPWQMGKIDQGVVSLWVASHFFQQPLRYIGFGGQGKQVRDVLHIRDLSDLVLLQMDNPDCWDGRIYNVGGGSELSVSLCELTELCAAATGHRIPIASSPRTSNVDLRIYVTDSRKVQRDFGWHPKANLEQIVGDIHRWVADHRDDLCSILV